MSAAVEVRCDECGEVMVEQKLPDSFVWSQTRPGWNPQRESTYFIHRLGRPCPTSSDETKS